MSTLLQRQLANRRAGEFAGIPSVCSAHPWVVRAAAEQAAEDGSLLLIEATSNQVNQFDGYTKRFRFTSLNGSNCAESSTTPFNHLNFLFAGTGPQNSNNATVFGSSNFGFVTAARDPRLIQIGAKLYY